MLGRVQRIAFDLVTVAMLVVFTSAAAVSVSSQAAPFDPVPKHIIMIMLDGFRPDYITMYDAPNLRRLVTEGAWVAEARSIFPTVTAPNQASFVTGALPASTGIPNNSRYDRDTDRILSPLRDIQVPTITEVMRDAGWTTAAVRQFMVQHRGVTRYRQGDIEAVMALFIEYPPGLTLYYNGYPDSVGHTSGPFSPQMREEVLRTDAEIGRLLDFLERQGLLDATAIVIASDHGMSPTDGLAISPSLEEIFAELGLRVATDDASIRPDTDLVYLREGSAFLYWRDGRRDPSREAALLEALRRIDGADVLTADDLLALGADPHRVGDIVVVPHEGRALTRQSGRTGLHGRPSESQTMLLFWGTGIKPGTIIHRASIIDAVPTILSLAKVEIPDTVDGRVLTEVLDRPEWKGLLGAVGDYQAVDIAASSFHSNNPPSYAADDRLESFWISNPAQTPNDEIYLELDLGQVQPITEIEIVSRQFYNPVGPKDVVIEASDDGQQYRVIYQGSLPPVKEGQSALIPLHGTVQARYIRLTARSGHAGQVIQIAEFRVWNR